MSGPRPRSASAAARSQQARVAAFELDEDEGDPLGPGKLMPGGGWIDGSMT